MGVHEFIAEHTQSIGGIEYIHKHNTHRQPLFVIFSGAIDRFVCISWFFESERYNCLWIKDSLPHMSFTDPDVRRLLSTVCHKYNGAVLYGMSMGGVGALLHAFHIPNTRAVIGIDCEARGISHEEFMDRMRASVMAGGPQHFKVHLISCSNCAEIECHNAIAQFFQNVTLERCPRPGHLSNIPSKSYLKRLFDTYGRMPFSGYYIDAWERVNRTDFRWT